MDQMTHIESRLSALEAKFGSHEDHCGERTGSIHRRIDALGADVKTLVWRVGIGIGVLLAAEVVILYLAQAGGIS